MAEKCFREIDQRVEKEILLNPQKRQQYVAKQEKKKYFENISKLIRKEMHMYG